MAPKRETKRRNSALRNLAPAAGGRRHYRRRRARSTALRLKNHRVIEVSDIEKIAQLVNEAATDTRDLSRALHRADIDSAGFITALQDLVEREIWKTPCRLEIKQPFHIDDDAVAS